MLKMVVPPPTDACLVRAASPDVVCNRTQPNGTRHKARGVLEQGAHEKSNEERQHFGRSVDGIGANEDIGEVPICDWRLVDQL
jgi:hypothetical protein